MPDVTLRAATDAGRPVLERLWLMFRHDLSEFRGVLPNPDGTFRSERLLAAFHDPDWMAYVLTADENPVGLAVIRGLTSRSRVLSGFFVVRGARRTGVGLRAVRELIGRHPGHWEIPFQDDNAAAVGFWRRVASDTAPGKWTEDRHRAPGKPDLPRDVWICFDTAG